jgi:succinylglutamic semialdehyde dehydrogenase
MTRHPLLARDPADLIAGQWRPIPGSSIISTNPARPADTLWSGSPRIEHVGDAVEAARHALPAWSRRPREERFAILRRYADLCKSRQKQIAELIADETGKVMWDAEGEASALAGKVDITLDATEHGPLRRMTGFDLPLAPGRIGRAWFRPHGVMAVIAPFNFPAHLANGHIVPALAMGNTIVLKPSDKAPAVGQLLGELFEAAGVPAGVVNIVQGGADAAKALVAHPGIDGILFTGSWPVGRRILEANLDNPGRIVALEMGGNNAAIVMDDADLKQAAIECVRSAFVTTGQRCTCTRRLIVHEPIAARLIPAICKAASNLIVGDPRAPHPVFMGPIISDQARAAVLGFQSKASKSGGEVLVESAPIETPGRGWFLSPGVMKVNAFRGIGVSADAEAHKDCGGPGSSRTASAGTPMPRPTFDAACDEEVFGPLLRISIAPTLDDAIAQANSTRYGLAASIFTKNPASIDRFLAEARAGCVNVNTGTAGASSKLPFGGLGLSGNHRPAGSFSLDYCAYPVAGMIESDNAATTPAGMRFEEGWLR